MLNIENYDQWAEVCDDDELISELYDSGVRPGTDEFRELLGEPYSGEPASLKDYLFLIGGIVLSILSVVSIVKLIKLACRKVKQFISNKFFNKKERP